MLEIGLLKMGHLLCLAYWLGADLGVFYSSYFVADDRLSGETRASMAKLMLALDQGPRICMPLILASGVHLGYRLGLVDVPGSWVAVTWIVCLGWLAMVLTLHFRARTMRWLTPIDYGFRVVVVAVLGSYGVYALAQDRIADWLAYKLLVFAGLVSCGLVIRSKLKRFGPALAAVTSDRAGAADNAAIRESLSGSRPFVITIWVGLLVNTALSVRLL